MTDSEMIVLFALAMLALALLAIAVDWVGKPIHRRFIPKIYRYPDEVEPPPDPTLTEWSDDTFLVPENPPDDAPMLYADGSTEWSDALLVIPEIDDDIESVRPLFDELPEVATDRAAAPAAHRQADRDPVAVSARTEPGHLPERGIGWRPGQYVFNRTRDGAEPSAEVIRRRFWRNVGSSDHVDAFGQLNAERLRAGRPPARHNPRSGTTETMSLRVIDFLTAQGKAPTPRWPDDDIDPYTAP